MKIIKILILLITAVVIMGACSEKEANERATQIEKNEIVQTHSLQTMKIVWLQDCTGSSHRNFVGAISNEQIDAIVNRLKVSGGEFCFGIISDTHTDQLQRLGISSSPKKKEFHEEGNPLINEINEQEYANYAQSFDSLNIEYNSELKKRVTIFKDEVHSLLNRHLSSHTDFNSAFSRAVTCLSETNENKRKILVIVSDAEDNMNLKPLPEELDATMIIINPFPPAIAKKYGAQSFEGIQSAINYLIHNF